MMLASHSKSVAPTAFASRPSSASRVAFRTRRSPLSDAILQTRRVRSGVLLHAASNGEVPSTASVVEDKSEKLMDVVFISAEVAPWSKTGGLGDVVGSLPVELAKRGHNVFSIAPRFDQYADAWDTSVVINVDGEDVRFFHTVKQGVHRVWVDHPWFLAKVWGPTGSKLYGSKSGSDYIDNQKRFSLFCKAAIEALDALTFLPGEDAVLVANDWHTALVPVLLKDVYQPQGRFTKTPCTLTVHNIAFQGRFWPEQFSDLGLPESSRERFEFSDGYPKVFDEISPADENSTSLAAPGQRFAKINWLRAGISACDRLVTVSPNYAVEITSGPALGVELHGIIKEKGVSGIVNGMDVAEWNPALDSQLAFKYNEQTLEAGKSYAKAELQREVGLDVNPHVPLFGFIGRLEEQKGVDILLAALERLSKDANIQVVALGTGKTSLEAQLKTLKHRFPGVAVGIVKFSTPLAHLITAGADFMVVPSRFEPCGLIQMHSMAYGTIPLVASTGGLVDTVKEGVTGFQMGAMDIDGLVSEDADAVATTMMRAAEVFGTPAFDSMRHACIAQDLSWAGPAKKWEALLTELKFGSSPGTSEILSETATTVPTPVARLENPAAFPPVPEPKPAEVAAATAAPKFGSAAPPVSPIAAAVAATEKSKAASIKAPIAPTSSREAGKTAAKASVSKTPAPTPAKKAPSAESKNGSALKKEKAPKAQNGTASAKLNGSGPVSSSQTTTSATPSNVSKKTAATASKTLKA